MLSSIVYSLAISAGTWFAWRILRVMLFKGPLASLPGPRSDSWITGSLLRVMDRNGWDYLDYVTKNYGKVFQFSGFLQTPNLFVYDPKAMHHIFVKDFDSYGKSQMSLASNEVVFGMGLLSTSGEHHRKQRKGLNPVFSITHMREMVPTFYGIVRKLRQSISAQVSGGPKEIEMLSWMTRTALELIGQSGYGYSFDNLEEGGDKHPFSASIKNLVASQSLGGIQFLRLVILPVVHKWGMPNFMRTLVNFLPWGRLHEVRDMVDIMHNTSTEIFEASKASVERGEEHAFQRVGGGKDIMSILLKANVQADGEDKLPESELLAQISTLTFAGMDTTSNGIARILHLLAEHPEAQDKLRQEIFEAHATQDELDYDTLTTLPYLDAICRETLRLFPPIPMVTRCAMKDVFLPVSKPVTSVDGKVLDKILVPKGTMIFVSLIACNRDTDIWGPDALEWKPERWLTPLPSSVADAHVPGIYSHQMTFLGGGRACIGFKFSQLEMKVILSFLLRSFKFSPSEKKVEWRLNGIVQPTTADAPATPAGHQKLQLPLVVALL